MVVGEDGRNGGLWCSPSAKTSRPTSSAFWAMVRIALIRSPSVGVRPLVGSVVTSPTVNMPNCMVSLPRNVLDAFASNTGSNRGGAGVIPGEIPGPDTAQEPGSERVADEQLDADALLRGQDLDRDAGRLPRLLQPAQRVEDRRLESAGHGADRAHDPALHEQPHLDRRVRALLLSGALAARRRHALDPDEVAEQVLVRVAAREADADAPVLRRQVEAVVAQRAAPRVVLRKVPGILPPPPCHARNAIRAAGRAPRAPGPRTRRRTAASRPRGPRAGRGGDAAPPARARPRAARAGDRGGRCRPPRAARWWG